MRLISRGLPRLEARSLRLAWKNYSLDFSGKTCIMGILNVTPDSFSEKGLYFDKSRAVDRALLMVDDGADIIDIGGESSRPGSRPVTVDEELDRVIPVIKALSGKVAIPVSIDTCKAEVAKQAIEAGASIVNDISGMRSDPGMPIVVSEYKVPVVMMHMKGVPRNMQDNPEYEALIPEIMDYFRASIRLAKTFGIPDDMIVIDPGIGFGKTFDQNLQIINNLHEFTMLERPVLIGPSRKAFIGNILDGAPEGERIEGTAAAVAISIIKGADIVRVHDVKEMAKVARVADAIKRERVTPN